jgi:hypothetical protein
VSANSRAKLAAQQTKLMRALSAQSGLQGFDTHGIEATSQSLRQKRERTLAHASPIIPCALGASFSELFEQYTKAHALPSASAITDVSLFLDYLVDRDLLPKLLWKQYFVSRGWKRYRTWCAIWRLLRDKRIQS